MEQQPLLNEEPYIPKEDDEVDFGYDDKIEE